MLTEDEFLIQLCIIERLPPRKDRSNFERWVDRLMEECVVVNENAAPA